MKFIVCRPSYLALLLTLEGEPKVFQLPNRLVILLKDLVLPIVGDQVVVNESVIDHGWLHRLFVNLYLLLQFQVILHLLSHSRMLAHLHLAILDLI